jgi:hypothetical protein
MSENENDIQPVVLSKSELKDLMKETVTETLTGVGFDMRNPLEMQQDLAYLHEWRHTTESIKSRAIMVSVGTIMVGSISILWLGIKAYLSK